MESHGEIFLRDSGARAVCNETDYGMFIEYNTAHVTPLSATGLFLCFHRRNMTAYLRCPSALAADDPVIRQGDCSAEH